MVEAGAKEVTEEQVVEALEAAHAAIKQIVAAIDDLAKEAGKPKLAVAEKEVGRDVLRRGRGEGARRRSPRRCGSTTSSRTTRRVDKVLEELVADLPDGELERKAEAKSVFKDLKEKVLRDEVLEHGVRLDGRKFDEVRPIWIETGVLPRTHGSAVFTRGETQALVTCTLGTADDAQKIETLRGRDLEELHAPLQLPAVLGRRGRRSCAARAGARSATARSPSARSRR